MNEQKVVNLRLDDILPNRFQPRLKFNEAQILELAESIKEHGVIQPIVVRKIADKYEIIAGERRYKASVMAGKTTIPAIITDLNDKDSAEVALIENVQRQNLTAIEEAISYKKILDMGYMTQDKLAEKLGKTQSTIANKLRLLNLEEEVQEALLNEKISERHARSLLKLKGQEQVNLLNRIINERLTVRATDTEVEKILSPQIKTEIENDSEDKIMNNNLINSDIKFPTNLDNDLFSGVSNLSFPKHENIENFNMEDVNNDAPDDEANDFSIKIPNNPIIESFDPVEELTEQKDIQNNFIPDLSDTEFTKSSISSLNSFNDEVENIKIPQEENNQYNDTYIENQIEPEDELENSTNRFFNFDILEESESEEPKEEESNIPDFNINSSPFDFNPIPSTSNQNEIDEIRENTIQSTQIQPENTYVTSSVSSAKSYGVADMQTIINTIKSCEETVKKYGVKVDIDELELSDVYQIVFRVHKN